MARNRVAQKVHVDAAGESHNRAVADVRRVEFRFFDGPNDEEGKPTPSTVVGIDLENVPGVDGLADGVARQALAHGIAQKVGDEYSGSGDDLNASIESAQAMVDRILAGEWLTEREGGSERGNTILREAILAVLSKAGKNVDPETDAGAANLGRVDEDISDKERAKKWKNRPDVKAEMERIKSERAVERAKKARAAAKGAEVGGFEDFA